MRRVALNDNPCGRTVARAVRNAANTVLLERGIVLDARLIGCLRSLGVTHVYVQDERGEGAPDDRERAIRAEIALREERRFGDVAGDAVLTALLATTIEIKVSERLEAAEGATPPARRPVPGGANDA